MTTPYIRRPGIQNLRPPYLANKTTFFAFAFRTDPETVQKELIDPMLNAPLAGNDGTITQRYVLKTRFVLAVFNHIAEFRCVEKPDSDIGWFTEEEFATWMLIEDSETGENFWFHPFMVVDNFYALSIGREVYGFPKEVAQFDITKEPERKPLQARCIAIPEYDATHQGSWLPVATALPPFTKDYANPVFEEKSYSRSDLFLENLEKHIVPPAEELALFKGDEKSGLIGELALLIAKLVGLDAPFIFLKQFPEADNPANAVYQSIVEAPLKVTKVRELRPLLPWRLELADFDTHPYRRSFGRSGDTMIRPWFSSWMLLDFLVPAGSVRHQIS